MMRSPLLVALTLGAAALTSCGHETRTLDPIYGSTQPVSPSSPGNPGTPELPKWREVPGARVLCEREDSREPWLLTETGERYSVLRIAAESGRLAPVQLNELEKLATLIPSRIPVRSVSSLQVSRSGSALARETLAKNSIVDGKRLRIYFWDLVLAFDPDGAAVFSLEKYSKDSLGYPYRDLRTHVLARLVNCVWN